DANDYESNIIFSPSYKSFVDEAYALACGTKFAKYLQIAPSNVVDITKFVQLTNQKLKTINKNLKIRMLGKNEMTKKGLNLILAVNKGSNEEAKLLLLEYKNNPKSSENIGLVGKGVVFDAGGYCLKPSSYLIGMNQDMAGAAAVVGTIFSLAKSNKKVNVVCAIPLVKNLINQNSYIVHDIYQAYNKKSVEILNTDAEGRLILADAIAYLSKNYQLTKLVSISTLTGLSARYFGDINTPY
ncbi:leucyl aminopeptidase family protein, partial [bacterium]|nr:leucyl aminopeptidase family protein [bacterium]